VRQFVGGRDLARCAESASPRRRSATSPALPPRPTRTPGPLNTQHTAHSTQHTAHSTQHTAHSTTAATRDWDSISMSVRVLVACHEREKEQRTSGEGVGLGACARHLHDLGRDEGRHDAGLRRLAERAVAQLHVRAMAEIVRGGDQAQPPREWRMGRWDMGARRERMGAPGRASRIRRCRPCRGRRCCPRRRAAHGEPAAPCLRGTHAQQPHAAVMFLCGERERSVRTRVLPDEGGAGRQWRAGARHAPSTHWKAKCAG
jgi:hypothetical protein